MPIQKIDIEAFLAMADEHPVLDVRSPGEYKHARIPGAFSLPLFTDDERKVVGTTYKQQSREDAIKIGLDYFGPKMRRMVEEVEAIVSERQNESKTVLVHCWRGGMRSAGVAWLLDLYGFKVYTLAGGYKAYRNWVLQQFSKSYPFVVLGGYTGSGKTIVLKELQRKGETIIDLEQIACHKGSAFGALDMPVQPTQEMFDNLLATELRRVMRSNPDRIWLEDESQRIGLTNLPKAFWDNMRKASVYFLDVPFEVRLDHITGEYGRAKKEELVNAVIRIQKRLGGLDTKNAINFLLEDNHKEAFRVLLRYYDKYYNKALQAREHWNELVTKITCETVDAKTNAGLIQNLKVNIQN
ncbi:MAG: tRNA 2-selenouridine(34) synthase MnmH [Bacteroidetes bacterium]|nr:tRNA 2-selenouridine(34) synthase MnmH [Bacteroidota bacterium]